MCSTYLTQACRLLILLSIIRGYGRDFLGLLEYYNVKGFIFYIVYNHFVFKQEELTIDSIYNIYYFIFIYIFSFPF